MKNLIKLCLLSVLLTMMIVLCPMTAAAQSPSVNISVRDDVRAGNDFIVTVSFSSEAEIGMVQAALSYSKSHIEFIGSENAAGGGDGIVNISGTPPSGSKNMDIILMFRALSGGGTTVSVTNGTLIAPDGKVINGSLTAAADISVTGETLPPEPKESAVSEDSSSQTDSSLPDESTVSSSEADSSSMIPDDGGLARLTGIVVTADYSYSSKPDSETAPEQFTLKPDFSPDIFEYEVTVHNDTEYISVDAALKNKLDTIWYDGSVYLPVGMTPWTITVTTPDGAVSHAYYLRVIRHEEGYPEESSSSEESSSEAAVTTAAESYDPDKPSDQAEPPKTPSEVEPPRQPDRPLREKLTPILIIAICVIVTAVIFIVVRIKMRSKNRLGSGKKD